jgi:hypothetical protein
VAIVMLARAGTDALQLAVRHKDAFEQVMGWGLVAVGTFTLWGYSGIAYERTLALLLMVVPVVVYHLKVGSPLPRAAAWVVATACSTVAALRLAPAFLVALP